MLSRRRTIRVPCAICHTWYHTSGERSRVGRCLSVPVRWFQVSINIRSVACCLVPVQQFPPLSVVILSCPCRPEYQVSIYVSTHFYHTVQQVNDTCQAQKHSLRVCCCCCCCCCCISQISNPSWGFQRDRRKTTITIKKKIGEHSDGHSCDLEGMAQVWYQVSDLQRCEESYGHTVGAT